MKRIRFVGDGVLWAGMPVFFDSDGRRGLLWVIYVFQGAEAPAPELDGLPECVEWKNRRGIRDKIV
jgi:hypothetical protein